MSLLASIIVKNLSTYNTNHHNGKRFVNDPNEPKPETASFKDIPQMFKFFGARDYVSPVPTRNMSRDFTKKDAIRSWWINHATILFQLGEKYIITDPIFDYHAAPLPYMMRRTSPTPLEMEQLPKIDFILISHDHWDHLNYYSVKRLVELNPDCIIIAPLGEGQLIRKWGFNVVIMDWRQQVQLGDITVTCFPARHMANRYGPLTAGRDLWASYLLQFRGVNMYFTGDTAIGPHFKEVREYVGKPLDFAPMPIGPQEPNKFMRMVHLDPQEAADMSKILQTKVSFPMHWGTFPLGVKPETPDLVVLSKVWNQKESGRLFIIKNGGFVEYVNNEFTVVDDTCIIEQQYFDSLEKSILPKFEDEL